MTVRRRAAWLPKEDIDRYTSHFSANPNPWETSKVDALLARISTNEEEL